MATHPDYRFPAVLPEQHPRTPPATMPPAVLVAILTLGALAVVTLLSIGVIYGQRDAIITAVLNVDPAATVAQAAAYVDNVLAMQAAFSVGGATMAVVAALLLRVRRPWARIVVTALLVFFACNLVYAVLMASSAGTAGGSMLINYGSAVLVLASGVALWLPMSAPWYRRSTE